MVAFGKKLRESQIEEWQGYAPTSPDFQPRFKVQILFAKKWVLLPLPCIEQ